MYQISGDDKRFINQKLSNAKIFQKDTDLKSYSPIYNPKKKRCLHRPYSDIHIQLATYHIRAISEAN